MNMISNVQRQIYNTYLKAVFTANGRPFKYRKDFTTFSDDKPDVVACLNKLQEIFSGFQAVVPFDYFMAPYKIYPDQYVGSIVPINFYCTPPAIKMYKTYATQIASTPGDSETGMQRTVDVFLDVLDRCANIGMSFVEYLKSGGDDGLPMWVSDYPVNRINWDFLIACNLCGFDFKRKILRYVHRDEYDLYFGFDIDDIANKANEIRNTPYGKWLQELCAAAIQGDSEKIRNLKIGG